MSKKTIKDIDLKGKRVFVRCDFNVPMDENQNITDNRRIVAALPTIKYLIEQGCKIVLSSHLGRPKGEFKKEFSLAPVAKELSKQLGQEVLMAEDVVGESAQKLAENLQPGQVMLLENVRFHKEETDNDPEFAKTLASFGDIFVNDAFGTAHRAHASTEGVAHYLPAVSGFLIEKELKNRNIKYFKLTGATKVDERIKMVDEFNENKDIKVFLISLKAGGTGLNLTGADMVIHYDPWWNASAENQATDRAYRIGQKNNVQVYKLITKNSIEEKIYELQQKKSQLIDNMLDTKTSFISKLSKEDIMKLFE